MLQPGFDSSGRSRISQWLGANPKGEGRVEAGVPTYYLAKIFLQCRSATGLHAAFGMDFTLHSKCLVFFSFHCSATGRRARNYSETDLDSLTRLTLTGSYVALGRHKT